MEAIILAGGLGMRLREVVGEVPKPMAPINDKPFLHYIFKWLSKYSVKKVILSTGYKAENISKYFGKKWANISIEYSVEEKPLGTGGAIMNALLKTSEENILILNGDTYFPINLNKFFTSHINNYHSLSIALKRMRNFSRYGSVDYNNTSITNFNEKKYCSVGLINGGIYIVNVHFFDNKQFPEVFSFEKEILEKEAGSSELKGLIFNNFFIDIGIPEDYLRAKLVLTNNV